MFKTLIFPTAEIYQIPYSSERLDIGTIKTQSQSKFKENVNSSNEYMRMPATHFNYYYFMSW